MSNNGIFVIFGITGDLAKRKLLPALYHLVNSGALADDFKILGTTRRDTTVDDIINQISGSLESNQETINQETIDTLRGMITIVHMDISHNDDYSILKQAIEDTANSDRLNRLYYLAVPPTMFETIVEGLGSHGLHTATDQGAESRLLIEKPFGHDTASAISLIKHMEEVFNENAIYRVDHYLAKETAQNMLTFRFNNPLFKTVWDHATIDHIMITASEMIGIENRINFYEQTGALRDLIQSHLLQLLALVTMEEPSDRSAEAIHQAKYKVLSEIKPIQPEQVNSYTTRGQYDSYRQEVEKPNSNTETFAAIRLDIDNDRWRGVPVLLRAGKAMSEKITEISLFFSNHNNTEDKNILTIRVQPNEGIVLSLQAKKPSLQDETEMVQMEFCYNQTNRQPDAYERVLIDAIRGDKTLFTTDEEVLASWGIIENVLVEWAKDTSQPEIYASGSWGPDASDKLAESVNASWVTGQLRIC